MILNGHEGIATRLVTRDGDDIIVFAKVISQLHRVAKLVVKPKGFKLNEAKCEAGIIVSLKAFQKQKPTEKGTA